MHTLTLTLLALMQTKRGIAKDTERCIQCTSRLSSCAYTFCHSFSANPNGNTDVIKVNERAQEGKSRFISNKMYVPRYSFGLKLLLLCSKLSTWLGLRLPFEKANILSGTIYNTYTGSQFLYQTKGRCNQWYTCMYLLYAAILLTMLAWVKNIN